MPDMNIAARASLRARGRCSLRISIMGQITRATSMMKCGTLVAKSDAMGVKKH